MWRSQRFWIVPAGSNRTVGGGTRSIKPILTFIDLQQHFLTMAAVRILQETIEKLTGIYEQGLVGASRHIPSVEVFQDPIRLQRWWAIKVEIQGHRYVFFQIDPC